MTISKQHKWTALLCALALAGCAADKTSSDSSMSSTSSGTSSSSSSGSRDSSYNSTPSSTASTSSTTPSSSSTQTSYGVVQAIDQMQRQDVGVGAVGAMAAGGTTTGSPTDRVYRVTVRMDDGTSQMVVVDSMPSYKIGDRVRYNNGMLQSY